MREVADDQALLELLLADQARAPEDYRPTPYWSGYANRITSELKKTGLTSFRSNSKLLKGFGMAGTVSPSLPAAAWKRRIWHGLVGAPGFRIVVAEYERMVQALSIHLTAAEINLARERLNSIASRYPEMKIPDGTTNGGAGDGFEWRGQTVSANFVHHLARAARFYAAVDPKSVTSILEIGPGVGLSTLARKVLNPHLRVVVNVDIVPVGYIAGQFLASIPDVEFINYSSLKELAAIKPDPGERFRVYGLPPWSLPKVEGDIDFAFNEYSFQEMEPATVARYTTQINRLCRKGVMIQNSLLGIPEGKSPQNSPVTMKFIRDQLSSKFSRCDDIADDGDRNIDGALPGVVLLMRTN